MDGIYKQITPEVFKKLMDNPYAFMPTTFAENIILSHERLYKFAFDLYASVLENGFSLDDELIREYSYLKIDADRLHSNPTNEVTDKFDSGKNISTSQTSKGISHAPTGEVKNATASTKVSSAPIKVSHEPMVPFSNQEICSCNLIIKGKSLDRHLSPYGIHNLLMYFKIPIAVLPNRYIKCKGCATNVQVFALKTHMDECVRLKDKFNKFMNGSNAPTGDVIVCPDSDDESTK